MLCLSPIMIILFYCFPHPREMDISLHIAFFCSQPGLWLVSRHYSCLTLKWTLSIENGFCVCVQHRIRVSSQFYREHFGTLRSRRPWRVTATSVTEKSVVTRLRVLGRNRENIIYLDIKKDFLLLFLPWVQISL